MRLDASLFDMLVLLVTGIWLAFRVQRWLGRRHRQRRAARAKHDAAVRDVRFRGTRAFEIESA